MDDTGVDEATRAWLLSCVPTPPPSPERAEPAPEYPASEGPGAAVAEASGSQNELADDDGFKLWERNKPYFDTMRQAEGTLNVKKMNTQSGGQNNCLCYAFLVGSGELSPDNKRSDKSQKRPQMTTET